MPRREDEDAIAYLPSARSDSRRAALAPALSDEDLAAREWSWQELGRLWRTSAPRQRPDHRPPEAGPVAALLSAERAALQAIQFVLCALPGYRPLCLLIMTALLAVSIAWRLGALPSSLAPHFQDQATGTFLITAAAIGWLHNATFIDKAARYVLSIAVLACEMAVVSQSVLAVAGVLVAGAAFGSFVLRIGRRPTPASSVHTDAGGLQRSLLSAGTTAVVEGSTGSGQQDPAEAAGASALV